MKKRRFRWKRTDLDQSVWYRRDTVAVCLFSVLLFFAMTLQTGNMSLILAGLAIVLTIGRVPLRNFRAHLSVPVLGLIGFAVMCGLGAVYSSFGSYATSEFYKILASVSLAVILLARFEKKHTKALVWGFCTVCAVIALLCVDMNSWGKLFGGFRVVMDALGADYAKVLELSGGTRSGIYNDANLTGALLGMAIPAGLYLIHTEEIWWKKLLGSLLLGVSSVAFLMAVSRGAFLCLGLTLIVYLAVAGKGYRLKLFFQMLAVGVSVALAGGAAMFATKEGAFLPVLLALVSGLLIFLLDWGIASRAAAKLQSRGKIVGVVCGALAVLVLCAGVAALTVTEPYVFGKNDVLYRSAKLEHGEYSLVSDLDGIDRVIVEYQDNEMALMSQTVRLWDTLVTEEMEFTVPEGSTRVFFRFYGEEGAVISDILLSDGTRIPTAYRILPESMAQRIHQGLFTGDSYLLRVQFVKDGLKLFARSPLIGHGLGSTEGLLTSVQPFYYESLYLHNHVVQVMAETGLLGLLFFLAFVLGSAWLLIRRIVKEREPLAAMLLAVWVMMNAHSLMEINFSIRMFQCAAFVMLLLPVLEYARPLPPKVTKWGGWVLSGVIWIYMIVFGSLLLSHRSVQAESAHITASSQQEFMNKLRGFAKRDSLDPEQHMLNFVGNAIIIGDPQYEADMQVYVKKLRAAGTYTAGSGLARYYYLPTGQYEEMFACSREAIAQEASAADAWNLQMDFYRTEVLPTMGAENADDFIKGVRELEAYLTDYSEGRLEEIKLSELNQTLFTAANDVVAAELTGEKAYLRLTADYGLLQ